MGRPTLVAADEGINHQIVATFGSTAHADPRWTEKIWAAIHDVPSGYQLAFGLGKYTNRGVLDGFAGLALENDQWAVRASRELGDRPDDTSVGPIRYEVLDPFAAIRFVLARREPADFAFDIVMRAWVPPALEARWPSFHAPGTGLTSDVLRYHQCGTAEGWLEHRGKRVELAPASSPAFRDHSWGVRPGVGLPTQAVLPDRAPCSRYRLWAPMMLHWRDGTRYGIHVSLLREEYDDGSVTNLFDGGEELASGARRDFLAVRPGLTFDPRTRHLRGGVLDIVDAHGNHRPLTLTPARPTGFHIGMGGYYGGSDADHHLGQWHGPEWSDVVAACGTDRPETVALVHQTRDVLCVVNDPAGGGTGYATVETILTGPFPELSLA